MTPAQDSAHWRIWNGQPDKLPSWWSAGVSVCAANGWRMEKGRLVESAAASRARSRFHERTWDIAERLAREDHRAVTVNDLRHACYLAAAGKQSHLQLSNKEFNRVLSWWKVLADPDDLDAMMEWDSPEIAERRGLVQMIRRNSDPGYAEEISQRKHRTEFWEDLPIADLRKLAITIKEQAKRNAWKAELAGETTGEPF
jgi:hypothetical protein